MVTLELGAVPSGLDPRKLRDARAATGFRQSAIAAALGWSRSRYNNYERGVSEPSVPHLRRIAELLGVPIDSLLTDAKG